MKSFKGILFLLILLVIPLSSAVILGQGTGGGVVIQTPSSLACQCSSVNSTFNQSAADALYIRQDGTSTTSDIIPFQFGVRIPQADIYFLFGDSSQGPGNLFFSRVEEFSPGVMLRYEPNALNLNQSSYLVLNDSVILRANKDSATNGTIRLESPVYVTQNLTVENQSVCLGNQIGCNFTGVSYYQNDQGVNSTSKVTFDTFTELTQIITPIIITGNIHGNNTISNITLGPGAGNGSKITITGTNLGGQINITTNATAAGSNAVVFTANFTVPIDSANPMYIHWSFANALAASQWAKTTYFINNNLTSFTMNTGSTPLACTTGCLINYGFEG